MSKYIYILLSFLVLFFIFFYAYISLMSKEHHYTQHELSPFFLYTPESLRNLPNISNVAEYSYYYNVDDMQTRVIVTWRNIDNIFLQKAKLIDFLKEWDRVYKTIVYGFFMIKVIMQIISSVIASLSTVILCRWNILRLSNDRQRVSFVPVVKKK